MKRNVKIVVKRNVELFHGPIVPIKMCYAAFVEDKFIGNLYIDIINHEVSEDSKKFLQKNGFDEYEIVFSNETVCNLDYPIIG